MKEQIKRGHSVTVFPLKSKLDLEADLRNSGADVNLCLHNKKFLTQLLTVRNMTFSNSEIIHAHLPQAEIITHFARSKNKLSTRHFGGKFYPKLPKVFSSIISKFLTRNKTVIAISQFVADYLVEAKEIKSSTQIRIIKYGFNAKTFLGGIDNIQIREVQSNVLVCGTLARLSPEKDLKTLIRGIYEFKRIDTQPIVLYIFGDGPEKDTLISLVIELGLTSVVYFFGKTSEPANAMRSLDIFILTSRFEGFGMVLLEAMSTHKIIIASDIPTSKEVLGMEGAASFFEAGNPQSLAAQISKSKVMSTAEYCALQEAQLNKYKSSEMALKIDEVYLDLLGKNEL